MTKKRLWIGSAAALTLAAAVAYGSFAAAQPYGGGWGMMGRGYGPGMMQGWGSGGGYGPGWMHGYGRGGGQGYGPGWRQGYGPQNCPWFQGSTTGSGGDQGNLNLSTDDVKAKFERWVDARGNPRLKVGGIREKDADTIEVDIVTKDNSLVEQFLVNRHTGAYRPSGG